MILKIKLNGCRLDIYDAIRFAQNKDERCFIAANNSLAGRCFYDGWIKSVVSINKISNIFPVLSHSDGLCTVTYDATVEIDYMKPGSIILATVMELESTTIKLENDRSIITVPISYIQDGVGKTQIDMNVFKPGQVIPILIKTRYMTPADRKALISGHLYIPTRASIRFIVKGKINFDELWSLIEIAKQNIEKINKIGKNEFISSILYPYQKDMSNQLDKTSMVSIIGLAEGSDDTNNYRFVKHSYVNWATSPYIVREKLDTKTGKYEDCHPPDLVGTIETTAQKFALKLLTDFIYNSELYIEMCNVFTDEKIKFHANLWRLMELGRVN